MQPQPGQEAPRAFAEGFFEVVGALLSTPVSFELGPATAAAPEEAATALEHWPVVLQARAREGGAAAVLLTTRDALRMAGAVFGDAGQAPDGFAEHDLATLTELGQHAMRRALQCVAERTGEALTLDEVKASVEGPLSDTRLGAVLEPGAALVEVRFTAPSGLDGEAVLVLPQGWGAAGPAETPPEAGPETGPEAEPEPEPGPDATLEPDPAQWDEIVAQLNPKKELGMAPEPQSAPPRMPTATPGNIDMVLDIRLVVRARLGRIEMPIGDILGLGPGSIVEVGRMLDEPVELLVNDKLIARGDVVVVDEKFGLRITEIVSPQERIESLR